MMHLFPSGILIFGNCTWSLPFPSLKIPFTQFASRTTTDWDDSRKTAPSILGRLTWRWQHRKINDPLLPSRSRCAKRIDKIFLLLLLPGAAASYFRLPELRAVITGEAAPVVSPTSEIPQLYPTTASRPEPATDATERTHPPKKTTTTTPARRRRNRNTAARTRHTHKTDGDGSREFSDSYLRDTHQSTRAHKYSETGRGGRFRTVKKLAPPRTNRTSNRTTTERIHKHNGK